MTLKLYNGKPIIGIDFGTTNTVVAFMTNGDLSFDILDNGFGEKSFPSIACYMSRDRQNWVAGHFAKDQLVNDPANAIYNSKRLVGRTIIEPIVKKAFKDYTYKLEYDQQGNPIINASGCKVKPEFIITQILKEVKTQFNVKFQKFIESAVITVPTYFNGKQRGAIIQAAKDAGLAVSLINEPTAAAIAYATSKKIRSGTFLVADFGGGTFDVSIVNVNNKNFKVLAVAGSQTIGGEDIDNLVMNWAMEKFCKENRIAQSEISDKSKCLLKKAAENAKICLSGKETVDILIPCFHDRLDLRVTLKRGDFDYLINDIISQVTDIVDSALEVAFSNDEDKENKINVVALSGGSSKIPAFIEQFNDKFGSKKVFLDINSFEATAAGACIFQNFFLERETFSDSANNDKFNILVDEEETMNIVTTPIGIMTSNGFREYFKKGDSLPARKVIKLHPKSNLEDKMDIEIYQAGDDQTKYHVASFVISGLSSDATTNRPTVNLELLVEPDNKISARASLGTISQAFTNSTKLFQNELQIAMKEIRRY
jgi:molecular chaperone DnaK (HSP70)